MLTTWLLDSRSARQLGLQTTGHAARGLSGPPGPAPTNLYMVAGMLTPAELMADIAEGLYVTELIGIGRQRRYRRLQPRRAGFMIRDGALAEPVAEITIAGNLHRDVRAHDAGQRPRVPSRHRRADDPGRRHDDGGRVTARPATGALERSRSPVADGAGLIAGGRI